MECNLEDLRIDPANMPKVGKQKKWRRKFIQMPWAWAERLRMAKRVSTYRLALVLIYEHWRLGSSRPLVLSNVGVQLEGLSRRSKWNALSELRRLGLVEVEGSPRKAPKIRLLELS